MQTAFGKMQYNWAGSETIPKGGKCDINRLDPSFFFMECDLTVIFMSIEKVNSHVWLNPIPYELDYVFKYTLSILYVMSLVNNKTW